MHGEIAATRDGKILGLRVNVLADHGAFNATAQPTKFPAGFFHIFTGSLRLRRRALQGHRRLHQQGARRRRLRLLVPHHRGRVPRRAHGRLPGRRARHGPGRAADEEPAAARAVPVHDARPAGSTTPATTRARCSWRWTSPATTSCAPSRPTKRARRRADGHRPQRSSPRASAPARASTWTSSASAWPTAASCASTRPARPQLRLSVQTPGPGPRDDVRPDRRPGARHPARGHRGDPRRHRQHAVRPRHLRLALDAGVRRGGGGRRPAGARQGQDHRRGRARVLARRPRVGARPLAGQGRPRARARRSRRSPCCAHSHLELPDGVEGHLDASGRLQPAEPHLPVRRLHLRRRRRPGHRRRSRCGGSSPSTTAARGSTR